MRSVLFIALAALPSSCAPGDGSSPNLAVDSMPKLSAESEVATPPKLAYPGPQHSLQWTAYASSTSFTSPLGVKGYLAYAEPTDGGITSCPLGVGTPGSDTITVTFGSPSTVTSSGIPDSCSLANGGSGSIYLGATF